MAFPREPGMNAVDTGHRARAFQAVMATNSGALELMIGALMGPAADETDHCISLFRTLADRMAQAPASGALRNERFGNEKLRADGATEKTWWLTFHLLKARSVNVQESKRNGAMSGVGFHSFHTDPPWRGDNGQALADRVELHFMVDLLRGRQGARRSFTIRTAPHGHT